MEAANRDAVDLDAVLAEYASRVRGGNLPSIDVYLARHPTLAHELRQLLPVIQTTERLKARRSSGQKEASPGSSETIGPLSGPAPAPREPGNTRLADQPTKLNDVTFLPAQSPDEIGRIGSYRVLEVLGRGGMGAVYLAEDVRLKRRVALKVMLPDIAKRPDAYNRFLREARAAASLDHDNIVTIFQVDEDRGIPFIAMAHLEGCSLEERLQIGPTPTPGEIARIGREVASGLAAAHARGIIHRDIKPGNIWLETRSADTTGGKRTSSSVRVKILDFGLARPVSADSNVTQAGTVVGTPAYMPPEQARGKPIDGRADLFSLGVVLYRMCTSRLPYEGDDAVSVYATMMSSPPASPGLKNRHLPPAMSDAILSLLKTNVEDRSASARDVAVQFAAIETELAQRDLPRAKASRRPWLVAAGVVAVVIVSAVAIVHSRENRPVPVADAIAFAPMANEMIVATLVPTAKVSPPVEIRKIPLTVVVEPPSVAVVKPKAVVAAKPPPIPRGLELIAIAPMKIDLAKLDPEPPALEPLPKDFINLFDIMGLAGWTARTGNGKDKVTGWSAEAGTLIGRAEGSPIATERTFEEFILVVEWRVIGDSVAGIDLHSRDRKRTSLEIELVAEDVEGRAAGSVIVSPVAPGKAFALPASVNRAKPAGQWNVMVVACSAGAVVVSLNGMPVIQADPTTSVDLARILAEPGPIGLNVYHGRVEFRRIAVKSFRGNTAPILP